MRDSYQLIRFEVRNQVATLTFNNPAKRNCFEPRMREEIKEVAVALIKRTLAAPGHDLAMLLEMEANAQAVAMGTREHREAVQCFLDKQPAPFQWPASS